MPIAYTLLPDRFEDKRHESFKTGLRSAGYKVVEGNAEDAGHGGLILGWNAYGSTYEAMRRAEKTGATALVFEEAYIRKIHGEQYFACAKKGHNGYGIWNVCGPERWAGWNVNVKPWRKDGDHILVCGQRGFGYNDMAMPTEWVDMILPRLRRLTTRPIWFRPHPKRRARMPGANYDRILDWNEPIENHLKNAWACVVYTSNSATNALMGGIPALYDGPALVTAPSSLKGIDCVDDPPLMGRTKGFVRLSWAQWSVAEFESGEAFKWLLT